MTVCDNLEEIAERLAAQFQIVERRWGRKPSLDDDAPAVAKFTMAGRAEDPVSLLPTLEDAAIDWERCLRGEFTPFHPAGES
jgi:hypothetical protein